MALGILASWMLIWGVSRGLKFGAQHPWGCMNLKFWRDFLENSTFLGIPIKFILLAKSQCLVSLVMFALKYLLKQVQMIDITPAYINTVITKEAGKTAMQLACQIAVDLYSGKDISYLDQPNIESDICFDREIAFSNILKTYVTRKTCM